MKRIPIYIVLIALVFAVPLNRVDVGTLQPVEILAISKDNNLLVIRTDTNDVGVGKTVAGAIKDLKDTASGIVYLDTAEFLLLEKGCEYEGQQLKKWLKGSVRVCSTLGEINMDNVAKYLRAHGSFPALKDWDYNQSLPILTSEK